ncbi:lipid-A-disaccharide synthase [Edaphobacter sp. HDX4]
MAAQSNPTIFLSAGEASGDHYGAQIIAELARRHSGATFFGLGGREMEAAGQQRIVRAEDVAHMGITEVLRHAPRVYGSYRKLVASIKERRPQVAILIDFPDVNFRLARELKALNIPVLYFVSPQLWAWKRRRLRWVQERVDRMMVIFPFEESFYRNRGVNAQFTGHPLAELPLPMRSREDYADSISSLPQRHWHFSCGLPDFQHLSPELQWSRPHENGDITYRIDPSKPWIALLPGSRIGEIFNNLPTMVKTAYELGDSYEYLLPVAKTITGKQLENLEYELGDHYLARAHPPRITLVPDAREALFHARASVVASGTATVQAAVIGNPFVVVYRVSNLTFRLAKRLVKYPAEVWPSGVPDVHGNLPIAMVNLIAGRAVVPELIQRNFTAANVASALAPLIDETPQRAAMIADLAEIRARLASPDRTTAIAQVSDAVEALLGSSPQPGAVQRGRISSTSV